MLQFRYTSNQYTSLTFFYPELKPNQEVYCLGPDKKRRYSSTNAISSGYCLIYIRCWGPIGIYGKGGEIISVGGKEPLGASETIYVSDLKTLYSGWALLISTIALIVASIKIVWDIIVS